MKTVTTDPAATPPATAGELPARVEGALGELACAAKEGLMSLSVGVGLGVLHELMEQEVSEVVGPKGRHNTDRTAKRHGHEETSVTLGARRVGVGRPRVPQRRRRPRGLTRDALPLRRARSARRRRARGCSAASGASTTCAWRA